VHHLPSYLGRGRAPIVADIHLPFVLAHSDTHRPTFATLHTKVQAVLAENPGAPPRGLGELLNKDLATKIRQSSVRVRKGGAAAASPDGRDASGLMGAVDAAPVVTAPGKLATDDAGITAPSNGLFG
jgi:hypothetical protein